MYRFALHQKVKSCQKLTEYSITLMAEWSHLSMYKKSRREQPPKVRSNLLSLKISIFNPSTTCCYSHKKRWISLPIIFSQLVRCKKKQTGCLAVSVIRTRQLNICSFCHPARLYANQYNCNHHRDALCRRRKKLCHSEPT